jgi:hypothetical protein
LTRHEGVALLPVVAVLLAWQRAWVAIPFLLCGELAWNVAKPVLDWPVTELPIRRFLAKGEPGHLGSGGPLHYVGMSMHAFGPIAAMLAVVGVGLLARRLRPTRQYDRRQSIIFLVAGGTVAMVVLQTLLYLVNTHESGGYPRFLIPAAPWAAVCVAAGVRGIALWPNQAVRVAALAMLAWLSLAVLGLWQHGWSIWFMLLPLAVLPPAWLIVRPQDRRVFAGLAAVVALLVLLKDVRPHRLLPHQEAVVRTVEQLRRDHPQASIVGDNPWTDYATDAARHPYFWASNDWRRNTDPPLFYVWDQHHSSVNLPLAELREWPHVEQAAPALPGHLPTDFVRVFRRLPDAE